MTNPFSVPFDHHERNKFEQKIKDKFLGLSTPRYSGMPRMVNLQNTINNIGILTGWLPENFEKPFCDAGVYT